MAITAQFSNTTIRLLLDVCRGLGRDPGDGAFVGGFIVPMIGSLAHECGGFKLMEEGSPTVQGSLGGISFAQWTGMNPKTGRRAKFMAWCRLHHLHPYGYDAAVSFILHELTTTAKAVVDRTLRAPPVDAASAMDRGLMGRVIVFERLYEGAGVKHYESRYRYAQMAAQVVRDWAKAGFPEPGKYVMPKARFSAQFDREFGLGLSETTTRWDHLHDISGVAPSEGATMPDGRVMTPDGGFAEPKVSRRQWPEQALQPAEIAAIQKRLRDMGHLSVGMIDGTWNERVIGAISAMQAENGIDVDGHYGPATRAALMAGKPHKVSTIRATATAKQLLAAGEPTLTAVHPVRMTSNALSWASGLMTLVVGVASVWPQASSMLDGLKATFTMVPAYVWPAAIFVVAVYLTITSGKVKSVALDNFHSGASTALAVPPILNTAVDSGFLPSVPGEAADPLDALRQSVFPVASEYQQDDEENRPLGEGAADEPGEGAADDAAGLIRGLAPHTTGSAGWASAMQAKP